MPNPFLIADPPDLLRTIQAEFTAAQGNELALKQFAKDVNEFFQTFLQMSKEEKARYSKNNPDLISNTEQWLIDNANDLLTNEFLTMEEKKKLGVERDGTQEGALDSNEIKIKRKEAIIRKGAEKWEDSYNHTELTLPQQLSLLDHIFTYIELLRTANKSKVSINYTTTARFGLQRPTVLTYEGYSLTIPDTMESLRLLVDIIAAKALDSEMQRAAEQKMTDFDKLFVPQGDDTLEEDFANDHRLLKHAIFALQADSPSDPNNTLLVEQITKFVEKCEILSKRGHLAQLKTLLSLKFLGTHFPGHYLTSEERAKAPDLLQQVKIGMGKFKNLHPQQTCNLGRDLCKLAVQQLEAAGFEVSIIPSVDQIEAIYFAWTEDIQITVKKEVKEVPKSLTFKFTREQLKLFGEKVKDGNLVAYLEKKLVEAKSSTTPIGFTPSGSRNPTPIGPKASQLSISNGNGASSSHSTLGEPKAALHEPLSRSTSPE